MATQFNDTNLSIEYICKNVGLIHSVEDKGNCGYYAFNQTSQYLRKTDHLPVTQN